LAKRWGCLYLAQELLYGGKPRLILLCISAYLWKDGARLMARFCENNQMEPDIKIHNDADMLSAGRDQQIEAAVKDLMKK